MTQQEIIEGNKLIAEFMDGEAVEWLDDFNNICNAYKVRNSIYPPDKLEYHTSWDWLMPVFRQWINKAATKRNSPKLSQEYRGLKAIIEHYIVCVDIYDVHLNIVKAIQWYNTQHP